MDRLGPKMRSAPSLVLIREGAAFYRSVAVFFDVSPGRSENPLAPPDVTNRDCLRWVSRWQVTDCLSYNYVYSDCMKRSVCNKDSM